MRGATDADAADAYAADADAADADVMVGKLETTLSLNSKHEADKNELESHNSNIC